ATPTSQKVYYLNLQEIKGIRFGTRNPINYFDNFYNAELFLRAHGTYSIRLMDPIKFYVEAIPKNKDQVEIDDINEQYLFEFLDALQSSINQMSAEGVRISYVPSKSRELSKYMADTLDEDWKQNRGMEIQAVAIASVSYDEESQKLINMRNQGAMLGDPSVREGYVQGAVARGMESAGKNAGGSTLGFMGMQMGSQVGGGMASSMSAANLQQMQMQQNAKAQQPEEKAGDKPAQDTWTCECGHENTGRFCSECGKSKPEKDTWTCACGHENTGRFCSECGKPRPEGKWVCSCGHENTGKFCSECGKARP
ncbi:MAG: virion core protein, partial [Clostridia bacterium]|nr:virion core protein [Clostridia bacterium]